MAALVIQFPPRPARLIPPMDVVAALWSQTNNVTPTHFVGRPGMRPGHEDGHHLPPATRINGWIRPVWDHRLVPPVPRGPPAVCACRACAPPPASQPGAPVFNWTGLPLHLQHIVMQQLLVVPHPITPIHTGRRWQCYHQNPNTPHVPLLSPHQRAIFAVNRDIYVSASGIYYGRNTFQFQYIQNMGAWLSAIGPHNCALVRRIIFNWWDSGCHGTPAEAFEILERQCSGHPGRQRNPHIPARPGLTRLEVRLVATTFSPPRSQRDFASLNGYGAFRRIRGVGTLVVTPAISVPGLPPAQQPPFSHAWYATAGVAVGIPPVAGGQAWVAALTRHLQIVTGPVKRRPRPQRQ